MHVVSHLSPTSPTYTIEYDASLTGVGVIISQRDQDGRECDWKVLQYVFSFDLKGESRYQNTVEFIALVMGLAGLVTLGVNNVSVLCRGDNQSSLSWGMRENFKSQLGRRAALVLTTFGIHSNIQIAEVIHIAGKTNVRCDQLSRETVTPTELGFASDQILPATYFDKLCQFCDPTVLDTTLDTFHYTWKNLREITSDFFRNPVFLS